MNTLTPHPWPRGAGGLRSTFWRSSLRVQQPGHRWDRQLHRRRRVSWPRPWQLARHQRRVRDYITEWILALPGHRGYPRPPRCAPHAALRRSATPPRVAHVPTDSTAGVLETQVVVTRAPARTSRAHSADNQVILAGCRPGQSRRLAGARRLRDVRRRYRTCGPRLACSAIPWSGEPFHLCGPERAHQQTAH